MKLFAAVSAKRVGVSQYYFSYVLPLLFIPRHLNNTTTVIVHSCNKKNTPEISSQHLPPSPPICRCFSFDSLSMTYVHNTDAGEPPPENLFPNNCPRVCLCVRVVFPWSSVLLGQLEVGMGSGGDLNEETFRKSNRIHVLQLKTGILRSHYYHRYVTH